MGALLLAVIGAAGKGMILSGTLFGEPPDQNQLLVAAGTFTGGGVVGLLICGVALLGYRHRGWVAGTLVLAALSAAATTAALIAARDAPAPEPDGAFRGWGFTDGLLSGAFSVYAIPAAVVSVLVLVVIAVDGRSRPADRPARSAHH